jgi:hypothetical protein
MDHALVDFEEPPRVRIAVGRATSAVQQQAVDYWIDLMSLVTLMRRPDTSFSQLSTHPITPPSLGTAPSARPGSRAARCRPA